MNTALTHGPDGHQRTGTLPARVGRAVLRLSRAIAWLERGLVTTFIAAIFLLILANVATRAIDRPLIWVDELAIYLMVMTCFVGTSLTVRQRLDFAMTLMLDNLGQHGRRRADIGLSIVGLGYAVFLLWCCWRMFDPLGLWMNGFDIAAFTQQTMNFLYTDPTQTLGIPKWVVLLVLPFYALGLTIHSIANLVEDIGWVPRERTAEAVAATLEAG